MSLKEAEVRAVPKPGNEPKFSQKFTSHKLHVHDRLIEKSYFENSPEAHWRNRLFSASQFRFPACHSSTVCEASCRVTLIFNEICPRLRYSWASKKVFDITLHLACCINYRN
jgi:hypothetical protein